jgi:hypothetical protein
MKKGLIISVLLLPVILVSFFYIHVNRHSYDIPPIDDADLLVVRPVMPATNNAYHVFTNAAQVLCLSEKYRDEIYDYLWSEEPSEKSKSVTQEQMASLVESNKLFFSFMCEGVQRDHCVIENAQESPLSMSDVIEMNEMMLVKIKFLMEAGKVDEALDTAMISLRFGELLERDAQDSSPALAGISIISSVLAFVDKIMERGTVTPDREEKLLKQLQRIKRLRTGLENGYKAYYSFVVNEIIGSMETARYKAMASRGATKLIRKNYAFKPNSTKKVLAEYWRDQIERLKYPEKENRIPLDMSEYQMPKGWLQKTRFALGQNCVGKGLLVMCAITGNSIAHETEAAHKTEEKISVLEKKLLSRQQTKDES